MKIQKEPWRNLRIHKAPKESLLNQFYLPSIWDDSEQWLLAMSLSIGSIKFLTIPGFPVLLSIASEHPWAELYSILFVVMVAYWNICKSVRF